MTLDELVAKLLELRAVYGGDVVMYTDQADKVSGVYAETGKRVEGKWQVIGLSVG